MYESKLIMRRMSHVSKLNLEPERCVWGVGGWGGVLEEEVMDDIIIFSGRSWTFTGK